MQNGSIAAPRGIWPIIVGVAYLIVALPSIELLRSAHGVVVMWAPSGILLASLLMAPPRRGMWLVASSALACTVANLVAGSDLFHALGYCAANMAEAAIAAWLLRRRHEAPPSFLSPREFTRFCVAAGLAALASASIAAVTRGQLDRAAFLSWFATDALGMMIVTPTILTCRAAWRGERAAIVREATPLQAVMLIGLVTAVSCAVFAQSRYPLLFLPMVALLAATYRLGPFGAATGVLIVALVSSVFTELGQGPLWLIHVQNGNVVWFLQFYVATLYATALPLAALLAAQSQLMDECAESERVHRLLADQSRDIVARLDLVGAPLYVSPACRRVLGWEPEEVIGVARIDFIHSDDQAAVVRAWRRLLAGAPDPTCVYRERRRDGEYVWLEATYTLVRDAGTDAPVEVVASIRDVTQRRTAELAAAEFAAQVAERNRLLTMAERIAGVGHWRLELSAGEVFWSPEVYRIHDVDPDAVLQLDQALAFYHADDRARVTTIVERAIADSTGFMFDARIVRSDGEIRNVVSRGEVELGGDGRLLALVGVVQDVTQQVAIERQLEAARQAAEEAARDAIHMADTDALTGVASRRKTLRFLADGLAEARETGRPLSIATFDLDHFKAINDRFGHATGDAVLRLVAEVAQSSVRAGDLVGRIGGEEFLVVFPGSDARLAMKAAERLRVAIERAAAATAALPPVTISIGVAELTQGDACEGDVAALLLHKADCALYAAKQAGRNTLQLAA